MIVGITLACTVISTGVAIAALVHSYNTRKMVKK